MVDVAPTVLGETLTPTDEKVVAPCTDLITTERIFKCE